ncbi:MAG: T9SS type A sorting domain-containing protein, partial [Ignavibacteriaceae bacterium]|nr:T9SS type A sorting domain-containing protein [Ignavibacteriaceae bacterium]
TLYIGTDAGVFFTQDLGTSWKVLGTGLPNSPVYDINYHQPTQKLVAGTHGRSLFEIDLSTITVVNKEDLSVNDFKLYQNYPNPFNPKTLIKYSTPVDGHVTLKIYSAIGEEVIALVNEFKSAGDYEISFFADNITSGIYFYRLEVNNFGLTRKMILLK